MPPFKFRLTAPMLGIVLYAALGMMDAGEAHAQCVIGPFSLTIDTPGSYFFNFRTCTFSGMSARVWVDREQSNGFFRHAAGQRVCGQSAGQFRVFVKTLQINTATGTLQWSQNSSFQSSCFSPLTEQSPSGNWFVAGGMCAVGQGC